MRSPYTLLNQLSITNRWISVLFALTTGLPFGVQEPNEERWSTFSPNMLISFIISNKYPQEVNNITTIKAVSTSQVQQVQLQRNRKSTK